ncbi:MAG: sigma-70 family RNA polymerase sigma factor [Acidobacteria bacterium]|nr:sigma-70 family RNA polymerase sigma factor [Acidobacteriota bacterium]MBI3654948.1 sigma-70 family RNA polymerase sigma factor [Acidobacteriota bacterium]
MSTANDKNFEAEASVAPKVDTLGLVRKAKAGDLDALQQLYVKYVNRVLSFVYRMVGSKSEAEDIVQDTFVSAYQKMSELKEDAKFQSWLFTIARNNVYQTYRTRGVAMVSLDHPAKADERPVAERVAAKSKTPEAAYLSDELDHVIQSALSLLNDKQREVFVLSALKKLSYEQVAEIVGRSVGAVKMDIHRARLVVRERIKNYLRRE